MIEIDKKLNDIINTRFNFQDAVLNLQTNHNKLHNKLYSLLIEIDKWMVSSQIYMQELKQSIDKLEVIKENNPYGGITKTPLNQHYYDSFILVEKHNKQNGA